MVDQEHGFLVRGCEECWLTRECSRRPTVDIMNPMVSNIGTGLCYSPLEAIELVSRAGVRKGNMRPDMIFLSAVSGGFLVSFAGAAMFCVTTAPWFQENAPGLIRMVGALIFPAGLVMIL